MKWKIHRPSSVTADVILQMMHHTFLPLIFLALLLVSICGCDRSHPASSDTPSQISSSERQQLLDAVAEAEREAQNTVSPAPIITLATPPGWSKTEMRPLPPADHGFTVAYEHESGLAVTLYQFTRGHTSIPNDVNSSLVNEEMRHAKNGIEQAVQLGYWQDAEETQSKTVQLGDSPQQALWSQYHLTVDGMVLASDIYVWAQTNTLFKLRCTCRSEDVASNQAILGPLLTALGSSGDATIDEAK
ncbi:hypothetical protein NHH03_01505 [Stieleria sp. TO1_6]|uniref:hypothetical protein n=1 Tax=Stieleria tagensis TaxID=2956795 RepID=UPI00209B9F5E|nr:hypothetical protein [Stieleria tagensis]MCO8120395.1 hypothetical protein [Stieleria tagensis]